MGESGEQAASWLRDNPGRNPESSRADCRPVGMTDGLPGSVPDAPEYCPAEHRVRNPQDDPEEHRPDDSGFHPEDCAGDNLPNNPGGHPGSDPWTVEGEAKTQVRSQKAEGKRQNGEREWSSGGLGFRRRIT